MPPSLGSTPSPGHVLATAPSQSRYRPRPACDQPARSVAASCYRTGFENAHGTVFRELLYSWHPWCGLQVAVHEAITRADGIAFRCTLTGSDGDRWLEVPAWMFDRATCPDQARLAAQPSVGLIALSALAELLRPTSSNALHRGASSSSHEQTRREGHGSDGFSQHEQAPEDVHRRSAQTHAADRAVRRRTVQRPGRHSGVAGLAGSHAGRADQPDGTADPGPCRNVPSRPSDGGRP